MVALREAIGLPGMNVVARVADVDWRTDSVLYTSTHDSDTLAGWWQRWGRENQPQLAAGATLGAKTSTAPCCRTCSQSRTSS